MTDEGAKALAAAIEKLADAIKAAHLPIIVYPQIPITQPMMPPQMPWQSPFFTACAVRDVTGN